MTKAYHINSEQRTIREVQITSLDQMQSCVGGWIERAPFALPVDLYVNEEGLLRRIPYGFTLGHSMPFVGNALLIGMSNSRGESTDIQLPLSFFAQIIKYWGNRVEQANDRV